MHIRFVSQSKYSLVLDGILNNLLRHLFLPVRMSRNSLVSVTSQWHSNSAILHK
jgi:hypothetical protein